MLYRCALCAVVICCLLSSHAVAQEGDVSGKIDQELAEIRQPTLIGIDESVAFRVIATQNADAKIAEAAKNTTGHLVRRDEQVIAEWVPIGDSVSLDVENVPDVVTRRMQSRTEVLVLHTVSDISENEIAALTGFTDNASRDHTLVRLTDAGSRMLFPFTVKHRGRAVAVIAEGEVRAVPQIISPVRNEFVLSPEKIDKVRLATSGGKY